MSKRHEPEPLLPALKAEGEVLLKELREKLKSLDTSITLVGFFNLDNPDNCTFFPSSDAVVITLNRDTRNRREKIETSVVPIIEEGGRAHIGGDNWFYRFHEGKRHYTRSNVNTGNFGPKHNRPVGIVKDLNETKDVPSALTLKTFQDVHLLRALTQMVDEEKRLEAEKYMKAPKLMLPVSGHMRLRRGSALDNLVLDCAVKGIWANGRTGNFVRSNCKVKGVSDDVVIARTPLLGGHVADGEVDPDVVIEDGHIVEEIHNPEGRASIAISNIFGVTVRVKLVAVVGQDEEAELFENQTIFAPLPKGDYTLEQLKARPDWEALCYLAVLSNTEHRGNVEYVDYSVVVGDGTAETCVFIPDGEPMQKLRTTGKEASGAKRFLPHVLKHESAHVSMDLFHTPIRTEIKRLRLERQADEDRRKKAASKRTVTLTQTQVSPLLSEVAQALMTPPAKIAAAFDFNKAIPSGAILAEEEEEDVLTIPVASGRDYETVAQHQARQAKILAEAEAAEEAKLKKSEFALISPDKKEVIETFEVTPAAVPAPVAVPVSSPGQVAAAAPVSVAKLPMPPMPVLPLPELTSMEFEILKAAPLGGVDYVKFFLCCMAQFNEGKDPIFAALTKLHNMGLIVVTSETVTRMP